MTINYKLVSAERKPLVAATSEILEVKAEYLGKKGNYGYQIGEYNIDRNGVLSGGGNQPDKKGGSENGKISDRHENKSKRQHLDGAADNRNGNQHTGME